MRIQHNIMAMNAYRNYNTNTSALSKNLEKLSSGYKINRAGDDAAGLAISEKMRAQITGLSAAQKNVKDGISLVKTAEGAMQEIQDMLNRMDYLATQSANGTYDNDVDRANLQKEVDQLLSEINRIADSSNFNGTKLLDGKLGLNDTAFSFDSVAATEASDGKIDITTLVPPSTDTTGKFHLEGDSATAATPTAKIDLGDLKVNVAANTTATVTFNIAGKDYEVKLKNTSTTDAKEFTTAEIGTELVKVLNKDIKKDDGTTTTNQDAMKIGDAAFTAANTNGVITLTYEGTKTDGTNYKAETTFSGTKAVADALNTNLGFDVKVKTVSDGAKTGDVVHKATNVEQAVAAKVAEKAGIDINLNSTLVDHGGKLTIDGKTFVFKTDATKTVSGGTVIDVSAFDKSEWVHKAADLLSKQAAFTGTDSRSWKIGVNGNGTTIHIDQTADSATGKKLDSYSKLISVISANGKATDAANLGTKITVTDSAVKEGDTLTIDGKVYVFADKTTTEIPEGATKVAITGGAGKNLANAISGAEYKEADKAVIVRAAKKDAAAPMVTGKGLQLQIGDTSDTYNQLQVKIGDMHAKALGIAGLSISNPDDASKAIQTIKNAINSVSSVRGDLGATQNRLEHTSNNLSVMKENIQDAESTIRDTDVAEEMMAYTKNNILIQSAQAMLAQANAVPQGVLQLLG